MANDYESTVGSDSIDYNAHMNVAHYGIHFEDAARFFFRSLDLSQGYRDRTNHALFAIESYFSFRQEAKLGDRLLFKSKLVGLKKKALHVQCFMLVDGKVLAATNEVIYLHMSLGARKPAPIDAQKYTALQKLLIEQEKSLVFDNVALHLAMKR